MTKASNISACFNAPALIDKMKDTNVTRAALARVIGVSDAALENKYLGKSRSRRARLLRSLGLLA